MSQTHLDIHRLSYDTLPHSVKGLQCCRQGLAHSPSYGKTGIAWILTWLVAANVVLFHWLSTQAVGNHSNGATLHRPGVGPHRSHPHQGWRFVSCAPVIAALLFGCSANASSLQSDDCLFNWAESNYPNLFASPSSPTVVGSPYTYRYYSTTNTYLGVSSFDNHVYYLGPDGKMEDEGPISDWLPKASCPAPVPPQIDCLFNWAERNYPSLFAPLGSVTTVWFNYTYRYYSTTKSFLAVSSEDNHVYYIGADGNSQNVGPISFWLSLAGCQNAFAGPAFPVIYIHGLNSSALAWAEPSSSLKDFLVNNGGWVFGGSPTYDPIQNKVTGIQGSGDFYTLSLNDNPNLGLNLKGGELSSIIQAVLNANPSKGKVILVGHSMGGLVAREYLQGLSKVPDTLQGISYRGDVDKLITVGTPHQGSYIAEICSTFTTFCEWLGYDPSSTVITDLRPDSAAINTLNDLQTNPLPNAVSYFSILGTGVDTISSNYPPFLKSGDFIVSALSQDISKLSGVFLTQPKSVTLEILDRGDCDYHGISILHLCEPGDPNVWQAILLDL